VKGERCVLEVAGRALTVEEALKILELYPQKTPAAFDLVGCGELGRLTAEEVARTRKISSRISNDEAAYFVERSRTAPWMSVGEDLADAAASSALFVRMTDLYWHFAEKAPKGVSFAKISKVLHLKQPGLYPILDSHLARAYAPAAKELRDDYPELGWRRRTWLVIRNDLLAARASGAVGQLRRNLRSYESDDPGKQDAMRRLAGLTDLRLLDIMVW
jgi:Family of unknown function (DUF6308)